MPVEIHVTGGVAGVQPRDEVFQAHEGIVQLDLQQPGVWYVTPRAEGYWGETRTLVTPHESETFEVRLWPAATLRASLSPRSPVTQVAVRFQPIIDESGTRPALPPGGASDCAIKGKRVECVLPAGRMDYSLRSFGHIPHYRWDQVLKAAAIIDLGTVEFRKGASLTGRVTLPRSSERGTEAKVRAQVTLTPHGLPPTTPVEDARSSMTAVRAVPDKRGRFVFEGLTPGAYVLSGVAQGLITERREVVILEGLEAELRAPLVFTAPLTLSLTVEPPMDPWRGAWILELLRVSHGTAVATTVDSGTPNADGRWTASDLIPGAYQVKVRRAQGVWHSESILLTESGTAAIVIPLVKAAGELLLGDSPIPGSIWFGGEFGEISVPVTTDKEGIFRAFLPAVKDNVWEQVDVVAENPPVRATLAKVRLSEPNSKGISVVDIVLPANRLYGEVTTKEGTPVSPVMVYADPDGDETLLQIESDEAGFFAFNGLAAGKYSVRAMGPAGKSRAIDVTIDDGADQYLRITLEKDIAIEGTVSSRHGALSGAKVSIYPEDRTGFGILPWDQTDVQGRFRVAVPPYPRNMTVTVAAPGFAFKIFDLPAQPDRPLAIGVEQPAGLLISGNATDSARRMYLFRGQAFLAFTALEAAGAARRDGAQFVVENLEPGHYDVCLAAPAEAPMLARAVRPKERCRGGFLAPGGTLDLRSPALGTAATDALRFRTPPVAAAIRKISS